MEMFFTQQYLLAQGILHYWVCVTRIQYMLSMCHDVNFKIQNTFSEVDVYRK